MKQLITAFALFFIFTFQTISAQLRVNGANYAPITGTPAAATGLQQIIVLNNLDNVSLTYTLPSATSTVVWSTFGYLGASQAQPIDPATLSRSGNEVTLSYPTPNTGYVIAAEGQAPYYFWLVDLSTYPLQLDAIVPDPAQSDCQILTLTLQGSAPAIPYYSITARRYELSRDIELSYNTLTPNSDKMEYTYTPVTKNLSSITGAIHIDQPLCTTDITLSGDRFFRAWGLEQTVNSGTLQPTAVSAIAQAVQKENNADNQQKTDVELGGSAPVDITFEAAVSDAVAFHEWQLANDTEFDYISLRSTDLNFSHTFSEMGTFYVRFFATNADASCEWYSDTYVVNIGESVLLCPNAFSPGASPGVNDEWKVSYKSIVKFECHIFDRWGTKMTEFHDPSQGWDGKYKGKYVPSGVYYYVIKARGADGREYNKAGDINILKSSSK